MAYPILAPNSTWYKSSAARSTITEINIVDSYTPTGSENETWNADVDNSGTIKCYRTGTVITIAGNGSGKIAMNADSDSVFSCTDGKSLFTNLEIINGADILDTGNVSIMSYMFDRAISLRVVDLSTWNTANVTKMNHMFQACISLESLDLSNWDVGKVTTMRKMFHSGEDYGFLKLVSIGDVSRWNTANVTNMDYMFHRAAALKTLNISNWDTSNVTNLEYMFGRCHSLMFVDLSSWNVSNVTKMTGMFSYCSSLKELDLSNWNTSNVTSMQYMFTDMTSLEEITLGTNFNLRGGAITNTSYNGVLPTPSSTYIVGADGNWYDKDGKAYTPSEIPNGAGTYYAAIELIEGEDLIKRSTMLKFGNILREKLNTTNQYTPAEMIVGFRGLGEQATPVISVNTSGLITATAGTKSSTYQLAFQAAKTITPSTTSQIAVSSGYYTGGNITVNGDSNLVAGNIKSGVSIFGVNGTYIGNNSGGNSAEDGVIDRTLSIYTNDRVTKIGNYAFCYCTTLASASFPNCTQVGNNAFAYCSSLTSVNVAQCSKIGKSAFYYCTSLSSLTLPACTDIGSTAFARCTSLMTLNLPGTSICALANSDAFSKAGITSSTGSIYVNANLVNSYKTATNWTYYSNRIFAYNAGGDTNLITFTIYGKEYQAEAGMTWYDWVNSDYNTEGYYIDTDGYIYTADSLNSDFVARIGTAYDEFGYEKSVDEIIANHDYTLEYEEII